MNAEATDGRWKRLVALLEPIHDQALATARRLCRCPADGDDLYQESVLRAFEKLHTLRDESRFRSWFYATLLSRHRSRHRATFWRRLIPLKDAFPDGREPVGEDGARWSEDAWRASRAAQALSVLPAVQREAVVLFEIDGYMIEEIAVMQEVSVSAVKTRLSRGRQRLRRIYESNGWLEDRRSVAGSTSGRREKNADSGSRSGSHPLFATVPAAGLSREDPSHE